MYDPEIGDGAMTLTARRPNSPVDRFETTPAGAKQEGGKGTNKLDSPVAVALHSNLLGHHVRELERQSVNRREMATDERFYDNDPWTESEKFILAQRGQLATNYNVISTTLNWLIGTERRGRTDYKVLPRRKEGAKAAERKTDLMKYLSDANNSEFAASAAFADAVKCGIGWMESGWQDDSDGEPVYDRRESWRNMLWDSLAPEPDFSDGRYMFRTKWVDNDIAMAQFSNRKQIIELASTSHLALGGPLDMFGDAAMDEMEDLGGSLMGRMSQNDLYSGTRNRTRLIEAWFRKPVMSRVVKGGDFNGELFDDFSMGHMTDLDQGRAEIIERVRMRMHVAIMATSGFLYLGKSPYRHNRFPFTPIICYRRASDGMPYGLIRGMRDLQIQINKSASKAQYILSTNKTIMEKGAVDDLDEYEEEAARPDSVIVVNPGKRLDMNADRSMAKEHLEMMSMAVSRIQQQSGVTDESLGRTTNAVSGKAIVARQDQGALATAEPFDNLRFARKIHGEKVLSLAEQFISEPKSFRITNQRGTPQFVTINDGMPDNDISLTKADFILSEQSWNASQRQAQMDALLEMIGKVAPGMPQILMITLDLIFEASDISNRDEIVKRIRQVTGMKDPDADPNAPPTPQEKAQIEAKAKQDAMTERGMMAEVEAVEAKAGESKARAAKADADAQKVLQSLSGQNVETQMAALQAAMATLSAPGAVPVADLVLKLAGYLPPPIAGAMGADTGVMPGPSLAQNMAETPPPMDQQPQPMPSQDMAPPMPAPMPPV